MRSRCKQNVNWFNLNASKCTPISGACTKSLVRALLCLMLAWKIWCVHEKFGASIAPSNAGMRNLVRAWKVWCLHCSVWCWHEKFGACTKNLVPALLCLMLAWEVWCVHEKFGACIALSNAGMKKLVHALKISCTHQNFTCLHYFFWCRDLNFDAGVKF